MIGKYYVILHRVLEHLQVLVSKGGPGTNALQIPREDDLHIHLYMPKQKTVICSTF